MEGAAGGASSLAWRNLGTFPTAAGHGLCPLGAHVALGEWLSTQFQDKEILRPSRKRPEVDWMVKGQDTQAQLRGGNRCSEGGCGKNHKLFRRPQRWV